MIELPSVKVDWKKCQGYTICVGVCPVDIFEMQDLPDYPDTPKAVPVREKDCTLCMACVEQCPVEAITVKE